MKIADSKWPRRLVMVFAIVCLVEILAGYELYRRVKRGAEESAYQELSAIFDLKLQQIASWREERIADASFLAGARFVARQLGEFLASDHVAALAIEEDIRDWLGLLKRQDRYAAVMVLDADLRLLICIPASGAQPGKAIPALFQEASRTRNVVMGDLGLDPQINGPAIDLVIPIFADSTQRTGQPLGAVVLRLDARRVLFRLVQTWPTPSRTAETVLVRREGNDVLYLKTFATRRVRR